MIRFIYGNPGTGKTEEIFKMLENDAENHKNALLIVPEQMTVDTERELLKRLPASAQLHIEVLNYTRLANKLFREHGGVAYNFSTRGLQKLLMWRALMTAAPFLCEYSRSGDDDIALADSFLATYNEFSAAGISLSELESVALSRPDSALSGKLKDIVTICSIYSSLLSSNYSDTNSELHRLCELLKNTNCLSGTNVYFDGFSSITGVEHSITKSIFAQADNCAVTLGIPSPTYRGIDTVSIKRFSDKLRSDVASLGIRSETVILEKNHRSHSQLLGYVSSDLWEVSSDSVDLPSADGESIRLFRAADVYDECEYAAVTVRELIEVGYRYNEIAIISRNADKYRGIIEPALENMDIPYYVSEKSDLSLCPISKLILSALRITIFGWQRNDVISHLKTGLCGIHPREADVFEDYTAKWNINGKRFMSGQPWNMNPDGYTSQRTERGERALNVANSVKDRLISRLSVYSSELKASDDCKEMCLATARYLEELNVKDSLKQLAEKYLNHNKPRQASECIRMYDLVLDALDCVCDAFSDYEQFDLGKFYIAVKTALEESELGTIPTSTDEVTIGSANMLRTSHTKCAILLGVCDGEFPSNAQNTGLLNDVDRDYLINNNIGLSGDKEMRASDELYYFRRAAASPSEKLIIFTRSDAEPSIAFNRIQRLFGDIRIMDTASEAISRFKTVKSVTEYLPLYTDTDIGEALKRLASEFGSDDESIYIPTCDSISAENDTVSSQILDERIGSNIRLSQSKIEEFIKCKFAYSCKYYLKLEESKRISFAYNNIGTFVHKVLERFLYHVYIINKGSLPTDSEKEIIVDGIISLYTEELIPDKDKAGARLQHLIERLKRMSTLLLDDILAELSDSSFIPRYFELPIGDSNVPSITVNLKDGKKISLNGIADRVDVFEKDGVSHVRVVDYKTGNKVFSLSDIEEGKNLQLLIYLFSLTASKNSLLFNDTTPSAAGITYISSTAAKVKSDRYDSADDSIKAATNEIKRSGLILDDADVISAVSRSQNNRFLMASPRKKSTISRESFDMLYRQVCDTLTAIGNDILTGNANAVPKDGADTCKYCPYSAVCRASVKKH